MNTVPRVELSECEGITGDGNLAIADLVDGISDCIYYLCDGWSSSRLHRSTAAAASEA